MALVFRNSFMLCATDRPKVIDLNRSPSQSDEHNGPHRHNLAPDWRYHEPAHVTYNVRAILVARVLQLEYGLEWKRPQQVRCNQVRPNSLLVVNGNHWWPLSLMACAPQPGGCGGHTHLGPVNCNLVLSVRSLT